MYIYTNKTNSLMNRFAVAQTMVCTLVWRGGIIDAHAGNIFTFKLSFLAISVGQSHVPHHNVPTRGVFGTLELSHGSLGKRHNALLAAGASYTLKRNVCKQRTCVAIR